MTSQEGRRQGLPRFTIVTPIYNQRRYIRETIESVIGQNYPDFEYFVIDGGSTDGSVNIIREYESQIAWWVSEKDDGQTDALNKGFARATGDVLCWVNGDDVLFPGCLQRVAECYRREHMPDIITANIAYLDADGRIRRFIRVPRQGGFLFFRGVWFGTAPCVFFGRSLFMRVGGLNAKFGLSMDVDMWVRLMQAGARTAHVAQYLGGFRWHGATKTTLSLSARTSQENPETSGILSAGLKSSTPFRRALWRKVATVYQVLNLNYVRAFLDYLRVKGEVHWQQVATFGRLPSTPRDNK